MRRKAILKVFIRCFAVFLGILIVASGIQFLHYRFGSEDTIDMMLAQMSEESGMGAELDSGYLRHAMGLDKPWRPDLWPFDNESAWDSSSSTSSSSSSSSYHSSAGYNTIGLSAGGSKDIVNFRENIRNGYLPQPTDVTCEGLFYDYYFDTGMSGTCNSLFCPSYSMAVSRDPISSQPEYYISVGLNSGLKESDFSRKTLNLVLVLDISDSMSSEFDEYYYDGERTTYNDYSIMREEKIESAKDAIITVLDQLDYNDSFALVVFNHNARVEITMTKVGNVSMSRIERQIRSIQTSGSTNLDAGMELASDLFRHMGYPDMEEYENRIIVFTDAQANTGETDGSSLNRDVLSNAKKGVFTTFIGIGVDFNSQLVELMGNAKGGNYYSVHSPSEFRQKMEEEFDFMVTPLVFDLNLRFESDGWMIERVYGSPQADSATGDLMQISTLFPSKSTGGNTKGGLVLLKLRRIDSEPDSRIYLRVDYEDRHGNHGHAQSLVDFDSVRPGYYDNTGIRKGILLSRYASLLKNWMADERRYLDDYDDWYPSIDDTTGITEICDSTVNWERQSVRLEVSRLYSNIFTRFQEYFEKEMNALGDYSLDQELEIIEKLADWNG